MRQTKTSVEQGYSQKIFTCELGVILESLPKNGKKILFACFRSCFFVFFFTMLGLFPYDNIQFCTAVHPILWNNAKKYKLSTDK